MDEIRARKCGDSDRGRDAGRREEARPREIGFLAVARGVGRDSEQVGNEGFGCHFNARTESGWYDGEPLTEAFPAITRGLGATTTTVASPEELAIALASARTDGGVHCIYVRTDWDERVPG